jgi:NNP family nitrate/nitrite transporter-like MFS transporter
MFDVTTLWQAPLVNPVNRKARSIPFLNPVNIYGRVFSFAWFGFFIAFWAWYAFPPLLALTVAKDIGLTPVDIANSNIVALTATLLVRLIAGPACDRWGPRYTFVACLITGAVPAACSGGITNASGLMAVRFFTGILGGSFVPCQVWSTGFFDKNVVGTSNAIAAGLGNAGGGVTYL